MQIPLAAEKRRREPDPREPGDCEVAAHRPAMTAPASHQRGQCARGALTSPYMARSSSSCSGTCASSHNRGHSPNMCFGHFAPNCAPSPHRCRRASSSQHPHCHHRTITIALSPWQRAKLSPERHTRETRFTSREQEQTRSKKNRIEDPRSVKQTRPRLCRHAIPYPMIGKNTRSGMSSRPPDQSRSWGSTRGRRGDQGGPGGERWRTVRGRGG